MKNNTLKKIVLVDDDPDIREFMSYNLKKVPYEVHVASDGVKALKLVDEIKPDLIILDVMMPGMDGIQVCEKIRNEERNKNILICFLTARGEDYSQIAGFDAGADDYVTKPIKPDIFLKKIDALLRRANRVNSENMFATDNLTINFSTYVVEVNGQEVLLAKKEFALLKLLVSSPGRVFNRDEIYTSVWGSDIIVGDRTIDVHIRKLREKIGDRYITTLKGIGYKFNMI